MEYVTYEQFGAAGDGVTDDLEAIAAAHDYANEHDLSVRTTADACYYIGGAARTVTISTNTDWGTSRFIIDDRAVTDNKSPVFLVKSRMEPRKLPLAALVRGQKNAGIAPGVDCYVVVKQNDIRRFIRRGLNRNNGSEQTDNFELKADGTIAHELLWDFPRIDSAVAYPIDETVLKLRGGYFTTIANAAPSAYNYYRRNIVVSRSNVEIFDMHHFVEGEGETGAPYEGFLTIQGCARVTVHDCFFTPHKIYDTIGAAGLPVSMGTYDLNVGSATDVAFVNCYQQNILDDSRWGLIGSNFCKNIVVDSCIFSRMDAHQGVYNYTIRNSTMGYQGINAIGSGTMLVENCVLYGPHAVSFREDYGAVWDGDLIVRDVIWHPSMGRKVQPVFFNARNDGTHDFGYKCMRPAEITLENVYVDDRNTPDNYEGMYLFDADRASSGDVKFPYGPCRKLTIRNLRTASGKKWRLCSDPLVTPVVEVAECPPSAEAAD